MRTLVTNNSGRRTIPIPKHVSLSDHSLSSPTRPKMRSIKHGQLLPWRTAWLYLTSRDSASRSMTLGSPGTSDITVSLLDDFKCLQYLNSYLSTMIFALEWPSFSTTIRPSIYTTYNTNLQCNHLMAQVA